MPSITSRRSLGAGAAMGALALGSLTAIGTAPAQAADDGCTVTISAPSGGGAPQVGDVLKITVTKQRLLLSVLGSTLDVAALGGTSPVATQITSALDPLLSGVQTGLYTVTQNDVGKQLQAQFAQTGIPGTSGVSCTSATSSPVGGGSQAGGGQTSLGPTQVASSPRIKGKGKVGKRFKSVLGNVNPGTSVSYQWFKKGKKGVRGISGATAPTLKARRGFKGKKVFLQVTYVQPQHTPTTLDTNKKRVR